MRRKDREHRAPARAGGGLRRRCADHSVTRKFKSLSGPIILSALSFPVPIDERHHRSARRPRVRRSKRPGWIERQDHPRPRRRFAKRVARSTPIHRAETSSVKAVKVKVKSSLRAKDQVGWRSLSGAKVKGVALVIDFSVRTSVFARGFLSSRPSDLRAVQDKAATCRGKEAFGRRGLHPLAPSTVLSEVLASRSRRSTDRPREACPRV